MFNILWWIFHFLSSCVTLNFCNIPQQELFDGPSHFPVHLSSFPYSFSWHYLGLYGQLSPSLSLSSQSIPVKSVCISPNLWLEPLGEKVMCLARFPSRSPQAPRVPWGGRRRWGRQQRTVVRVTDGERRWPASVNVKTRLCRHLLSAAIFGWWKVSRGWAAPISCVQRHPVPKLFVLAPGWLRGGIRGRRQGLDDWNAAQTGAPFTTKNQLNRGKARPILSVAYWVKTQGYKSSL